MQKQFDNILDFTKLREKCLFCQEPLHVSLSNYISAREDGLPILHVGLASERFTFRIDRTTQTYSVKADGVIDIVTGCLVLTTVQDNETPFLDQHLSEQALYDLMPYVQLSCENFKCNSRYSLSTDILKIKKPETNNLPWKIGPPKFWLETFRTNSAIVQSDWLNESTFIYSRLNEDAAPLRVSFMDFGSMGKSKLLTRIQTLVVFS